MRLDTDSISFGALIVQQQCKLQEAKQESKKKEQETCRRRGYYGVEQRLLDKCSLCSLMEYYTYMPKLDA
jgi:hypothetical protein